MICDGVKPMADAYEIAQDLFNQGWRVKLANPDKDVGGLALYHFITPGGEEFESSDFYKMVNMSGVKFYGKYSWVFWEKVLTELITLFKAELIKKPQNPKLVVVGQLSDSSTWVMKGHFITGVRYFEVNELDRFEKSLEGLNSWLNATGGKKIKMTIEVLGEWED